MVLENAPQKEIVDPPKGNEILPKSSHKELSDLEQATTVAEKKQEVEDLKEEVQEQEPQPTYEEILEESYRQLLIRLFDESTAPWKTATQIIGLLEAQPKQKTVFQKARETLVLDLENKKQTWKSLLDQRTSPVMPGKTEQLPTNPYLQAYLLVYLVSKGIYEQPKQWPVTWELSKVQEATTFLYQYEKKKTDLTSEVGQHGYMIPTQLLHEQEALATRTPETTDIAYEANTNALLHYLESTPVISKITSYPLPFEHLREIVSNSGYQQMNQQELGTLLTYIPLRKEHSHRLEEVTVTVRGKNKTTSLATLPSATEVLSWKMKLTPDQEQAVVVRANRIREAKQLKPSLDVSLGQASDVLNKLKATSTATSEKPDVILENTLETQITDLNRRLKDGSSEQIATYNNLIETYVTYLDDHKHPDVQILRVISQYRGSQLGLLNKRALPQQPNTPGAWSNNRYVPGTLLEKFMQQVDLNGISTQDLITGIAEPFVSSITTDYYLSNRSRSLWDGNQSSPAEEEEKNTYLLPFQLNRYQHTFRRYDYLLHKQGNTAFGNERTAWASGIATTIINETVGEGDPRVNYTRPTPKAEILQAYCPAIAGELTRRYLRATDPAEKQQIKEASMRFAKTITDSVMIDGKTSFQQDETAFHLLIPIITDDLQLTAQIQAVKPEDIRADLAKECELPVARTASLAQLSQSLPEGKQELFKRYLTEYTTFSDMDLSLTALPCGDLIMLSSLWYTIKTDKQWSEQKFKAEIEKNMNIMTNHTQIVFPDPKPVSIQLFESVCDRLEARWFFTPPPQYLEAGGGKGKAAAKYVVRAFRRIGTKVVWPAIRGTNYLLFKNRFGRQVVTAAVRWAIVVGGFQFFKGKVLERFCNELGLFCGSEKEATGGKVQTSEEEQNIIIEPPAMKFDVILDTRSVQKTISQEIVYQIKESPSTSSRGKAGNRVKRSYNNFMWFIDKNKDVINMTTKAEIQVHCDLTEVDLGEMFQAERTGDPATSVIDVNVPTFYLDIHMKPEDMIEVFKVVQTKESWMSNEEERVQVINDAFVQFYLFCIGQDNSATNSTEDDTENKERQEDIAEMIGDAEKMFENKYRELVHSTLPPKYKNIPPKNIIFHFNNEPAVLIETFYDRVTKNEKHRNMFPYAEPIDNTNN